MTSHLLSRLALLPLLAALALAAPTHAADGAGGGAQARNPAAPVAWSDLEHARWIADGRDDAPRKVYVFMDANCKYCTKFWSDARPWVNSGKVQLRHLMVAVIAPTSAGKAATLLADPDPARRLSAYEQAHAFGVVRMMAGGPRHGFDDPNLQAMASIPAGIAQSLHANAQMMQAMGLTGTPGIVFRGLDGKLEMRAGIATAELATALGTP